MATVAADIDVEFNFIANITPTVQKNFDRPEADHRPWETVALVPEDAPLLDGNPRMPQVWFRATPQLSTEGEHIIGSRLDPGDAPLGADMQWLPYTSSWNSTTGTWAPWVGTNFQYNWEAPVVAARPVFSNITYQLGREIITVPEARFTGTSYLTSNFYSGTADAVAFTISFALMMDPPSTGKYALLDWGIPNYDGSQKPPDSRTWIHVAERMLYGWSTAESSVDPLVPLPNLRPAYVTLVINPPTVKLFISAGPGFTFATSTNPTFPPTGTQLQFWLGKSTQAGVANGGFGLLSAALWSRALRDDEVTALNSQYASIYGASSEWS